MSVKFSILGLLYEKPRHAYEVFAAFQDLVGQKQGLDTKPAQVYTTLERLHASGMISSDLVSDNFGRQREVFSITPSGKQALFDWLAVPTTSFYLRSEFYTKLILKLAVQAEGTYELIALQRDSLRQEMQTIAAMRNQVDPQDERVFSLLLDHCLSHLEVDLHWLDKLEVSRRQVLNQPAVKYTSRRRGRPLKHPE